MKNKKSCYLLLKRTKKFNKSLSTYSKGDLIIMNSEHAYNGSVYHKSNELVDWWHISSWENYWELKKLKL